MAEGVGFEPTMGYSPMLVFKTSALNRSATPPEVQDRRSCPATANGARRSVGHSTAAAFPVDRGHAAADSRERSTQLALAL